MEDEISRQILVTRLLKYFESKGFILEEFELDSFIQKEMDYYLGATLHNPESANMYLFWSDIKRRIRN